MRQWFKARFCDPKWPPIPWPGGLWSNDDGTYEAQAYWRDCVAWRGGRGKLRARLNALRGVFFFRLLFPFTRRWFMTDDGLFPRWYFWLVE